MDSPFEFRAKIVIGSICLDLLHDHRGTCRACILRGDLADIGPDPVPAWMLFPRKAGWHHHMRYVLAFRRWSLASSFFSGIFDVRVERQLISWTLSLDDDIFS